MTPLRRELLFDLDAEAAHRGAQPPPVQGVAVVGPSGAETAALHDGLHARGLAVTHVVLFEGQAEVDLADALDWLASDGATRVVLLCLDRVVSARRFLSAARAAARSKLVLVLVVPGAGSAGEPGVLDAAIRRAGMLRLPTVEALCDAAASAPTWPGDLAEPAADASLWLQAYRQHQAELLETPPADPLAADEPLPAPPACPPGRQAGAAARAWLAAAGLAVAPAQALLERPPPAAARRSLGCCRDPVFGPALWLAGEGADAPRHWALPPLNAPLAQAWLRRAGWWPAEPAVAATADAPVDAPDDAPDDALVDGEAAAWLDLALALSRLLATVPTLGTLCLSGMAWQEGRFTGNVELEGADAAGGGADAFAILPYPQHWVEALDWCGQRLTLRPIRPDDEARHREFLASLSPEDIRLRLFHVRRSIAHAELARLTQIDHARELAFIATAPDGAGQERTLGVVRAVVAPDAETAEFAIVVRSTLKGHGLGEMLMHKLLRALRERGVRRLEATVLPENQPMRALARRLGFSDSALPGDSTRFIGLDLAA